MRTCMHVYNYNVYVHCACIQSFRHQMCDFSLDIILYDFVHSNIGPFLTQHIIHDAMYVMIRIDT